jgi:hypothetical protein
MTLHRVSFTKLVQDSHNPGSDEKHMVSRICFRLEVNGDIFAVRERMS